MTDQVHMTDRPKTYPAEAARQGSIALRTRVQRVIFIAGLAGLVVLALFFAVLALDASESAHVSLEKEASAFTQRSDAAN